MDINTRLENIKSNHKHKLRNLLKDVMILGEEYIIKHQDETNKKEKKNLGYIIDSLRRDACNISQELKGSMTYGGRKFDDLVDKTIYEHDKTVKKSKFIMYIDGIESVVETKIPMTKNEVLLELELELVDDNISDVYPLENDLDE